MFAFAALAVPLGAGALPEDDTQQIVSEEYASIELALDEGEVIQIAHPDRPTCISQGSRKICGAEIRFQRADDGTIRRVTATGTPASFQQQPAIDQEIVHFSGLTLLFDNEARLLTIDGEARYSQGQNELTQQHIEYHLDARRVVANDGDTDGDTESRGRMIITPDSTNGN